MFTDRDTDAKTGLKTSASRSATHGESKKQRKLLVLSDFDSRVKWGASLAGFFQDSCEITVMYEEIPAAIREKYFLQSYIIKQYSDLDAILNSSFLFAYDYVILALGGRENLNTLNAIRRRQNEFSTRPIIIAGFNGLVEPGDSHGFLCRQGADVICVNSKRDMTFFRTISRAFQLDEAPLLLTGYLRRNGVSSLPSNEQPPQNILFVEQVGRPTYLRQKTHLVRQLAEYARAHPTRRLIIKLRDTGWIRHANSEKKQHSFRRVWGATIRPHPANVIFSKESIEDLLPEADLCVSIASTVIFEALSLGKKVAVVSDFGIGTHMGNTSFIGSGLFASLQDLKRDKIPEVEKSWLAESGSRSESFSEDMIARIKYLDEQRERGALPPIKIFYEESGFPYVQPRKKPFRKLKTWMFHLRRISFHFWQVGSNVVR